MADGLENIGNSSDSEEGAKADRLNQQCFLIDNYQTYAHPRNNPKGFKNLTCMMGNPSQVLQRLTTKPGREAFLSMPNHKFAQLVPKIRFFKVPIDSASKKPTGGKKKEVLFRTFFNENKMNMTSNRSMRGDQVGLKEVSYQLAEAGGSDTIGKRVDVKVSFVADSIVALQQSDVLDLVLHPQPYGREYTKDGSAVKGTRRPNTDFSSLQLVYGWALPSSGAHNFTPAEKQAIRDSENSLILTLGAHELKFNENGSVELSAEYIGRADAKMDESSTNVLQSSLLNKTMIKLAHGAAEAMQTNVLKAQKNVDDAEKKQEERKQTLGKDVENSWTEGKTRVYNKAEEDAIMRHENRVGYKKDEVEKAKAAAAGYDTALEEAIQADRQAKYSKVLEELGKSGKIWFIDIDPEKIGRSLTRSRTKMDSFLGRSSSGKLKDWTQSSKMTAKKSQEELAKMTPDQRAKYDADRGKSGGDRGTRSDAPKPQKGGASGAATDAVKAIQGHSEAKVNEKKQAEAAARERASKSDDQRKSDGAIKDMLSAIGVSDKPPEDPKASSIADYNKDNTAGGAASPLDGKVRVNYIYWGDLFSIVLQTAYKGPSLPMRYLVGPINFTDPRTGRLVDTLNISDIPISLNLFTTWWLAKIVQPNRDVYTIRQFVRDSINELILAALGEDCYAGGANYGPVGGDPNRSPLHPPRVEFSVISAPLGQGQKDRLGNKGRLGLGGDDIKQYVASQTGSGTVSKEAEDQIEYMYIYCNAWTFDKDLSGNYIKDKSRGIYHVHIGNDSGPIKRINFEKDQETSDLMATQAQMEAEGISQLVASYECKISMIGNTLWLPANYVYVAPTALGVSTAMANAMGLGGYYTVRTVGGKIDSSGWTTDMECRPLFTTASERKGARIGGNVQTVGSGQKSNNPEVKQK